MAFEERTRALTRASALTGLLLVCSFARPVLAHEERTRALTCASALTGLLLVCSFARPVLAQLVTSTTRS